MVKAFIKPMNKDRHLGNFLYRYLVEPPLLYANEAVIDLTERKDSAPAAALSLSEDLPAIDQAPAVTAQQHPKRKQYLDHMDQRLKEQNTPPKEYKKNPIEIRLSDLLTRAYIVTYGFDGFDHTTNQIVFAEHNGENRVEIADQKKDISTWVLVASFFGLPTRPSRAASDAKPITKLGVQLLRNAIGGWEPLYEFTPDSPLRKKLVWTEKKVWQVIALFTVKPIIFLLKLIGIPFKIALNILKLFTEWLPAIITSLFAAGFVNAIDRMRYIVSNRRIHPFIKGVRLVALGALTLILGVLNYSSRILTLIGRAATSPEKSARMAYAAFSEYKIHGRIEEETQTFSKIFGIIGGLLSVLISMTVWTLTLPLAIGAFMTYVPVYLPTAYQFLASIAQFPLITKSVALVNSALAPVGRAIMMYAGPALSTVSTFLSINIPTTALILGTAIGALAAPITAILSRLADEFSNAWAGWFKGGNGPVNAIKAWYKRHSPHRKDRTIQPIEDDPDSRMYNLEPTGVPPTPIKTQDQLYDEMQPHYQHFRALSVHDRGVWLKTWAHLSLEDKNQWFAKWQHLDESQQKNWSDAWKYWAEFVTPDKTRFSALGQALRDQWLEDWLALRDPRPIPKQDPAAEVNQLGQALVRRKSTEDQQLSQRLSVAHDAGLRAEDVQPKRRSSPTADIELTAIDHHDFNLGDTLTSSLE